MRKITFEAISFVKVTCVVHSHSRLQRWCLFFALTNVHFMDM